MPQTPVTPATAQFQPQRDRTGSVANSVRFSHSRTLSSSSMDDDIFQQPPLRHLTRERGSFESLVSNRTALLEDLDSPGRPAGSKTASVLFKNLNSSSSTLLPLTRTVSFNSIHNGASSPTLSPVEASRRVSDTPGTSGSNAASKGHRLSRLFTNRKSTDSNKARPFSPTTSKSSPSLNNGNSDSDSISISSGRPSLLQRQMSRSMKDKRSVNLSIQTSNLNGRADPKAGEVVLPRLTEALNLNAQAISPQLANSNSISVNSKSHKHHLHLSHHNLLRPRSKESQLSSSSSNSKFISNSGETLYSFSTSGGNLSSSDLQRTFQQLESLKLKELVSLPDKDLIADECYSLLSFLILPIFSKDALKVTIEDLNRLLQLYLSLRLQDSHSVSTPIKTANSAHWSSPSRSVPIFDEIRSLLNQGFNRFNRSFVNKFPPTLSTEQKVVKVWTIFRTSIFYYLEGLFLPLQLELQGLGVLLKPDNYQSVWKDITSVSDLSTLFIKRLILISFRDHVIIPIYENDEKESWMNENGAGKKRSKEVIAVLQQCFSTLESIRSNDSSQNLIERLFKDLLDNSR